MSDTPRTDRMEASWPLESFGEMTGLARQLERENAALREQLAERDAEIAALKGHAEALRNRLVEEYTIGPCVDQTVGAALPHEVYDFDAANPKED